MRLRTVICSLSSLILLAAAALPLPATVVTRHQFGFSDGFGGSSTPLFYHTHNTYWYGTTEYGGTGCVGTLFRVKDDGTGYQILHHFTGGTTDGQNPLGKLYLHGDDYFYGATELGGADNAGTIFKIKADGSDYQLVHVFNRDDDLGYNPTGGLVLNAGRLWGMTSNGGSSNRGTVYKLNPDGTGYAIVHHFAGGATDGAWPGNDLIAEGSYLFGLTRMGGSSSAGTVFRLSTAGTFTLLHSFAAGTDNGTWPGGSLALDNSWLYGITAGGGTNDGGTLFKIGTGGSGFSLLHSFTNGLRLIGTPLYAGGSLYGVTWNGGLGLGGTIYKVSDDGATFETIKEFTKDHALGSEPPAPLSTVGTGYLFGLFYSGGSGNSGGVFKIDRRGENQAMLHHFANADGFSPTGGLCADTLAGNTTLYGATYSGGKYSNGTVFGIRPDGTGFSTLHHFAGGITDGSNPGSGPIQYQHTLYGTTQKGGASDLGTIYRLTPSGTFTRLHSFTGGPTDGKEPVDVLCALDGTLYGVTGEGGLNDLGTVFKILPDGNGYSILHHFAGGAADGENPSASLLALDGALYGVTQSGGSSDLGTIFKILPDGTFSLVHSFSGFPAGRSPNTPLIAESGVLYGGCASEGATEDQAALYRIDATGANFTLIYSFPGQYFNSDYMRGSLRMVDGVLFGATVCSGAHDMGSLFRINPDGSGFATTHSFGPTFSDAQYPWASLLYTTGALYGVASAGGNATFSSGGSIFSQALVTVTFAAGSGGSVNPSTSQLLVTGDSTAAVTATPAAGWQFVNWTGTGGFVTTTANPLVIASVNASMTVTANFALNPTITVTAPNGGETWTAGSSQSITWSSTGSIANVKIDYSTNGGGTWTPVIASTTNDGSHPWTIPSAPSTNCRVAISDAANAATIDTSNASFTIAAVTTHTVTFVEGSGGTISGTKVQTVNHGASTSPVTAVPNSGQIFVNWTGSGFTTSSANPLAVSNVTTDLTITANFTVAVPPTIGLNHGRLNFAKVGAAITSAQTLRLRNTGGGTLSWTATPSAGWIVLDRTSGSGNARILVSVNATGLGNGTYDGTISIGDPAATNTPQTVQIQLVVKNAGANPFGTFETPAAGATGVTGNIAVTGWVLDDVEVVSVKIYRSPLAGEGKDLVFIGDANLVEGARPDVEALYATYPWSYRSGWGYMMLTNFLPNGGNGAFTIHIVATDREGHSVTLGSKTITCDNAHATLPFGTLDTPEQGGMTSGNSYVNFGWALTPQPGEVPKNGSTITVWVDGAPVGHPTYDQYRSDIATLFPGYANSDGAVGFFYLNPSTLAEGAHSIAWSVEDSLGRLDGIGSRYFSVEHASGGVGGEGIGAGFVGATRASPSAEICQSNQDKIAVDTPIPLRVRRGFTGIEETIFPDRDGLVVITAKAGEPLAIFLDPDLERGEYDSPLQIQGRFAGIERVGTDVRPLPIGARLDPDTGVFTWLPGPGFRGTFTLEFISEKDAQTARRQRVLIRVGEPENNA